MRSYLFNSPSVFARNCRVFLFVCRFQTILRSFSDFFIFRYSAFMFFLWARKKIRVYKDAIQPLSLDFSHAIVLSHQNLWPIPMIFDTVNVGFTYIFHGRFYVWLNLFFFFKSSPSGWDVRYKYVSFVVWIV